MHYEPKKDDEKFLGFLRTFSTDKSNVNSIALIFMIVLVNNMHITIDNV